MTKHLLFPNCAHARKSAGRGLGCVCARSDFLDFLVRFLSRKNERAKTFDFSKSINSLIISILYMQVFYEIF